MNEMTMKKNVVLWMCALVLVMTAGVSSCSSDDEESVEERGDFVEVRGGVHYDYRKDSNGDLSNPLVAFFAQELRKPRWDGQGGEYKTFFEEGEWNEESIQMINSREVFQAAYMGTKELPDVDFDQYTLVIGRTWGNDPSYELGKTILRDKGLSYELETQLLQHHYKDLAVPCVIMTILYWRLYPKLPEKAISLRRTVKDVNG